MEILFLILKIIGIIILAVIGLVLLALLLLLFVPVRYRVTLNSPDKDLGEIKVLVKVSYLLSIVSFLGGYEKSKGLWMQLKLFGHILWRDSEEQDKEEETKEPEETKETEETEESKETEEKKNTGEAAEKPVKEETVQEDIEEDFDRNIDIYEDSDEALEEGSEEEKDQEKGESIFEKIKSLLEILKDKKNKVAFGQLKGELLYLLKHYMIREVKGDLTFSAGSPDNTGMVLGALSMFPFMYSKNCAIRPDFSYFKFYVSGEAVITGHVRLIHLAKSAVKLLLSKQFRRMVKQVMKWL